MEKEEIKGILHLVGESDLFDNAITYPDKEQSIGINFSADWETDTITCFLNDKNGDGIGTLVFDNTDFQSLIGNLMPPSLDDLPKEEPSEKEKKEIQEDAQYTIDNPVKKEIGKYHE